MEELCGKEEGLSFLFKAKIELHVVGETFLFPGISADLYTDHTGFTPELIEPSVSIHLI